MGERLLDGLKAYADHPIVGDVRGIGLMAAVELVSDKKTKARLRPVAEGRRIGSPRSSVSAASTPGRAAR